MKNILQQILANDVSYNKSATRYLYKTHPDLWQQIIETTSFLPDTALPKQRIWHVLNDVWSIPTCPITGQQVKWWENRYLETTSRSAKTTLMNLRGKTKNQTPESKAKRVLSNKKTYVAGLRKLPTLTDEIKQTRAQKAKETNLKRYGVPNGSQSIVVRQKLSDIQIKNGATPRDLRSLRRLYYDAVWRFTEQNWRGHFDQINPERYDRSKNALDHIYSIQQGFRDCIPPYIIGHWTNLRVIPMVENSIKGMRCDKSQQRLFEDFFQNTL